MNDLIIIDLPKPQGEVAGLWYDGYPVHKGFTEESLNYATLYAHEKQIVPDQNRIMREYASFTTLLQKAGFTLHTLPFPEELNQPHNLHHDAIFIRDAGLMFEDFWIQANFSVLDRKPEADVHARIVSKKFNKKIIQLPQGAYIEFGEVFLIKTKNKSYYFGGLSRSNKAGHDAVRDLIRPDYYFLIKSTGYHLDTVFSPLISADNKLIGFLLAKDMIAGESLEELKKLKVAMIFVDPIDSSGTDAQLGTYAINTLIAPGILVNCATFTTPGVEDALKKLGIKRLHSPLTDFRFAGGSYHCLTNEIYL